ncbi:MAG TPA: hypothetical protein VF897_01605 [Roseiflexaceae bacterium]
MHAPLRERAPRRRLRLIVWLCLLGALPLAVAPLRAQSAAPNQAGLVIDFGDGRVVTACVDLGPDGQATGEELLRASNLPVIMEYSGSGATVCKIDTVGCNFPSEACFAQCTLRPGEPCRYWAYSRLAGDRWQYAQLGASSTVVHPGDVDGWAWGEGTIARGAQPPVRQLAEICAASSATPSPSPTSTPSATATDPAPAAAPAVVVVPLPSATPSPSATPTPSATPPATIAPAAPAPAAIAPAPVVLQPTLNPAPATAAPATAEPTSLLPATAESAAGAVETLPTAARSSGGYTWLPVVAGAGVATPPPASPTKPRVTTAAPPASPAAAPPILPPRDKPQLAIDGDRAQPYWLFAVFFGLLCAGWLILERRSRR